MKKSYLLLFILILFGIQQSYAQNISTSDTLSDAFLTRPLSIVKEDIRWNTASTDLFTAWISNGLYGLYGPQPQIMLNGIPLNANFFGWQNLNMLPIFVKNIDKVSSQLAPGVYRQTAAGSGAINFKNEQLKPGFTAQAFYFTGNESKDPGPWAYDSLKMSPNIDRWGPDKGILVGYQSKNWFAKGLYLRRFHKPRDIAQNLRLHFTNSLLGTNKGYVNHPIYTKTQSSLFKAGFNSTRWHITSRFILGNSQDYLFLQPYGREVPTDEEYRQWAIQARYKNGPWQVKARYLLDSENVSKRVDLHYDIFSWNQLNNTISISGGYDSAYLSIIPGLIYKGLNINAPGLNNVNDKVVTLFLKSKTTVNEQLNFYLNSYLDYHRDIGSKSISFKFGITAHLADSYIVNPQIYYAESNPIRQHSFIYWVNRGYFFADRLNISIDNPAYILENEALSVKLVNQFYVGDFSLKIVPQLIKNYRLNIPWQVVEYYEATSTMPEKFTVSQHSGSRFKFLTVLNHSFSSLFQQSLTLYLQNTVNGSNRYRAYFKQIPDTKIKYQFDISPVQNLRISLNATYRSSTTWVELSAIDGKEYHLPAGIPIGDISDTFNITTPAFLNVGLSVNKWLLNRHLNFQIGIQNILDQEIRYHPMGASLYPKVNFQVTARF